MDNEMVLEAVDWQTPYLRLFDRTLTEPALDELRTVVESTFGRRPPLEAGARDQRWWVSLHDLKRVYGQRAIEGTLSAIVSTDAVKAAMQAVGPDPVAVLHFCIFRRFDPQRNPVPAHWHFDATLLGMTVPVVNTWFPLVDVGETAPGITIVDSPRCPKTLWTALVGMADANGLFAKDTRASTLFADGAVERALAGDPEVRLITPVVPAGGAISFDHQYLHGTQRLTPEMGVRESFEFRVVSERVARRFGLTDEFEMWPLF